MGIDFVGIVIIVAMAVAGAAIGYIVTGILDRGPALRAARALFVVLCSATAATGTFSLYVKMTSPEVRALTIETEITAKLAEMPFVARVFRDFPDMQVKIRERATLAFKVGGEAAFQAELTRAWAEVGLFARSHYLPRARNTDLIRFTTTMVRIMRGLAKGDPELCYRWITTQSAEASVSMEEIKGIVGETPVSAYEEAAAEAIASALADIPAYDAERAKTVLSAVGQEVIVRDGLDSLAMLSGQKPVTGPHDARKACTAAADMYERITRYPAEDAGHALRQIFAGEPALRGSGGI